LYSKSVETIFGNEHPLVGFVFLFFGLVVRYWFYLIGQNISLNWNYDSYFITSTLFDTILKKKKNLFSIFFDQKKWKILKKCFFQVKSRPIVDSALSELHFLS
jgi:hypothetical protein